MNTLSKDRPFLELFGPTFCLIILLLNCQFWKRSRPVLKHSSTGSHRTYIVSCFQFPSFGEEIFAQKEWKLHMVVSASLNRMKSSKNESNFCHTEKSDMIIHRDYHEQRVDWDGPVSMAWVTRLPLVLPFGGGLLYHNGPHWAITGLGSFHQFNWVTSLYLCQKINKK